MWALRVLAGPQKGQTFNLKNGRNLIGRAPQCDIKLNSAGISKEHAEIHVQGDKILIMDLRSSNGTFINGIKIQNGSIGRTDKVSVHDVIFDIVPLQQQRQNLPSVNTTTTTKPYNGFSAPQPGAFPAQPYPGQPMPGYPNPGMAPPNGGPQSGSFARDAVTFNPDQGFIQNIGNQITAYIEKVALPGIYKLAELFDFKMLLLTFVVVFIFVTTLLSLIPLVKITRTSILNESMKRAESLARSLEKLNRQALSQGALTALSTFGLEAEDGVQSVLIVQQSDGSILAPASRAGTTPDLPFVQKARRESTKQVALVDFNTVGASFPLGVYDPNTGEQAVKAHAIVLYNVGSLAFDDGQVISLFMQTLVLATLIGLIIFYLMFKLIERPIVLLNEQLDTAMRENRDNTDVPFQFPALQTLIGNLNSLLSRYLSGNNQSGGARGGGSNKDIEANNLAQMIPYPVLTVAEDGRIISVNQNFCQLTNISQGQIVNKGIDSIPDIALQQNISNLINLSKQSPASTATDTLSFSGNNFQLSCQAFSSDSGTISYFMIIFTLMEGGG